MPVTRVFGPDNLKYSADDHGRRGGSGGKVVRIGLSLPSSCKEPQATLISITTNEAPRKGRDVGWRNRPAMGDEAIRVAQYRSARRSKTPENQVSHSKAPL